MLKGGKITPQAILYAAISYPLGVKGNDLSVMSNQIEARGTVRELAACPMSVIIGP